MKKTARAIIGVIVTVLMLTLWAGLAMAGALNPPHDSSNGYTCSDCHFSASSPPTWWTDAPANIDDTPKNRLCLTCHDATGVGGHAETHSSLKTSNKYGDWTRECVTCHYPHRHEQVLWRQYETGLTGTITAINTATNTFTLSVASLPDRTGDGDPTNDYIGWSIIPNTKYVTINYKILSNTTNTVTVEGTIDTSRVAVGNTFGILPGKFVRRYVSGPAGFSYVKFLSNNGTYGLIDQSGTTRYGICQVCHSQTKYWRYDGSEPTQGHNVGQDCFNCHDHSQGLKPSCGGCHGDPPVDSSTLISADKNGTPVTSDSPGAGAHDFHANTRGYSCSTCHAGGMLGGSSQGNDLIDIEFVLNGTALGGTYDGKPGRTVFPYQGTGSTTVTTNGTYTCSNIYCHSDVQANGGNSGPTAYGSPVWTDSTSVQCGSCHKADGVQGDQSTMDSGSHTAHLNAGKQCQDCHSGAGEGTQKHADYNIDVAFQADAFNVTGTYSQSPNPPGNSYGSCSNVYCHSTVQADGGTGAPLYKTTPTWGGTILCGDCHASPPPTGSHNTHFNLSVATCSLCHNGAGSGTTKHADRNIDVVIDPNYGASATYNGMPNNTPGDGYSSCSNVYCHSDVQADGGTAGPTQYATPTWGGTVTCDSCHGTAGAGNGQPATGSHPKHVAQNGLSCDECHNGGGSGTANHANKIIDISLLQGGTYSQGSHTPGSGGYGSCSSTYCHGIGTPTWGAAGSVACGDCHAVNNTLAGSHSTHWSVATNATATDRTTAANNSTTGNYIFTCAVCHNGVTHAGGPVGGGQTAEVVFDATVAGGGTYTAGGTTNTDPNGFDYTNGSCSSTYCHSDGAGGGPNVTPTWGATLDCASCHNYTVVSGAPMASGKHSAHVGTTTAPKYAFNCSRCHNATTTDGTTIADKTRHVNHTKDVVFDSLNPSGAYDSGTKGCTNLYCHSDGNGGPPNVSVDWASVTLPTDCTGCHNNDAASGNAMASGSHTAHVNKGTVMSNASCDTCHTSTVSGDRTIVDYSLHVNGTKDVTINATYDGDTTPGNNYSTGQCSNLYCHSDGTSLSGPYNAPNTVPTWGTTTGLGCSDCHDGPPTGPSYTNGSPKANSHAKHTGAPWNFTCDKCHSATVTYDSGTGTYTISTPSNHLNKQYDISGADIGSYTYNAGGGTCSNIACHGGNSAQWGAGPLNCADCHLGTGDVDDYTFNNGTTARIDSTEWTTTGHGLATTSTYNISGNPGAGLTCDYCHDSNVAHGTSTNPFRLANYNVNGNGWNDVCLICHGSNYSGYDPGSGLKTSSLKIDKYHYGTKHGATNDGGSLCFDCHDPHGDSNIYMVHDTVTKDKADAYGTPAATGSPVFTNNSTGTDYAKSSAPFNGVCNVCHTNTNHYTSSSGDGHNSGTRCTTCHSHSGDTTIDGNAFQPSGGCDSCHGYPPAIGDGHNYMDGVGESKGAHTQHVQHLLNLTGYTLDPQNDQFGDAKWQAICGACHYGATHETNLAGQNDNSAARHIQIDPQYSFDGSNPVYNGVPGTSSNVNLKSCSNVRCHFKDSPGWQDPATAGQ